VSISARRTIRAFGEGDVPRDVIEEAVRAAFTAPAPAPARPWSFTALVSSAAKRRLLAAMAQAWRGDLRADGVDEDEIARRIARSEAFLGAAPVLIVPWVRFGDAVPAQRDPARTHAAQELFLLSAGAAIQNLLLAFHAQGYGSCWTGSTLFCQEETREALEMGEGWFALGAVAAGPMPAGVAPPRPPLDLSALLSIR
jgi:coenzyme F420-0:L-glutamate ligase/coenzyme F420-1:gamma-L-glutamate ligase